MKRLLILSITMLFVGASLVAAQEQNGRVPFNFRVWSKAEWAPFVFRGDINPSDETIEAGPGFGVGSGPGWDGIGAVLGFEMEGSGAEERLGFALNMRAASGDGNIYSNDNTAYVWVKPFGDILKLQMGRFVWSELDDRINQWEQDIFQNLQSNTFGSLFIVTPPAGVPDALKGLMLFSCWGVSGNLDAGSHTFAANTTKGLQYILSSPQAGIAYRHDAFGLARFQFIPSNYIFGDGQDWFASQTNIFWSTYSRSMYWFPSRAREALRFELALNLTKIPNFFIDLGFGFSTPVTVVLSDLSRIEQVGPSFQDRGYRPPAGGLSTGTETRIAHMEGDMWLPAMKAAVKVEYYPPIEGLGFRFRTKVEFGEQVAFYDNSDNFFGGTMMEFGLESWKTFANNTSALVGVSLRSAANDSFNGKKTEGFSMYNESTTMSLNHNGRLDMGVWGSVSKSFAWNGSISLGFSMNIPLGGDRYDWSDDSVTGFNAKYFSSETAEMFKKSNLVIMIPITVELSLY